MNPVGSYSSRSIQSPLEQNPVESNHNVKEAEHKSEEDLREQKLPKSYQGSEEAKQKSEEKGLCPGIITKISGFFATFCKRSPRSTEGEFTYSNGEYVATIKTCVDVHDEKRLRAWLKEYSAYKPSQILFGKYFISIEMIQNYMVSLLESENVKKTDGEIREALNKFVSNQHRRLLQILHPDKHGRSGLDLQLLDQCSKLIRDATDQLKKELPPTQD